MASPKNKQATPPATQEYQTENPDNVEVKVQVPPDKIIAALDTALWNGPLTTRTCRNMAMSFRSMSEEDKQQLAQCIADNL